MKITIEEVMAGRSPKGGWTKAQLAEWGIGWPPPKGWIKQLTGEKIPKAKVEPSVDPLAELSSRISELAELNQLIMDKGCLSEQDKNGLFYQNIGFYSVLELISQLQKRGSLWKGGYLDNVGVTYEDQVAAAILHLKQLS